MYWNSFVIATDQVLEKHYIDYFSGLSNHHISDLTEQLKNYKIASMRVTKSLRLLICKITVDTGNIIQLT